MNPTNPTREELESWAFNSDDWPDQNWDMFLCWHGRYDWYIQLADDYSCPKRQFFIDLLYYCVAQNYKEGLSDFRLLDELAGEAKLVKSKEVRCWRNKLSSLKNGELKYERENWWSEPLENT